MIEHTFEPIKARPQPSVKFAQENPNFLKPRKAPKVFRLSTLRGWVLFFQIFFRGPSFHGDCNAHFIILKLMRFAYLWNGLCIAANPI